MLRGCESVRPAHVCRCLCFPRHCLTSALCTVSPSLTLSSSCGLCCAVSCCLPYSSLVTIGPCAAVLWSTMLWCLSSVLCSALLCCCAVLSCCPSPKEVVSYYLIYGPAWCRAAEPTGPIRLRSYNRYLPTESEKQNPAKTRSGEMTALLVHIMCWPSCPSTPTYSMSSGNAAEWPFYYSPCGQTALNSP